MMDIREIVRESGMIDELQPVDAIRQRVIVRDVVNPSGGLNRAAILPHLPPMTFSWAPGATGRHRVPRAGVATVFAAFATTAPTSGPATVTLAMATSGSSSTPIGTVQIPQGQTVGEETLTIDIPAGAWVFASVTTANGASGVSSSVAVRMV